MAKGQDGMEVMSMFDLGLVKINLLKYLDDVKTARELRLSIVYYYVN